MRLKMGRSCRSWRISRRGCPIAAASARSPMLPGGGPLPSSPSGAKANFVEGWHDGARGGKRRSFLLRSRSRCGVSVPPTRWGSQRSRSTRGKVRRGALAEVEDRELSPICAGTSTARLSDRALAWRGTRRGQAGGHRAFVAGAGHRQVWEMVAGHHRHRGPKPLVVSSRSARSRPREGRWPGMTVALQPVPPSATCQPLLPPAHRTRCFGSGQPSRRDDVQPATESHAFHTALHPVPPVCAADGEEHR